MLYFWLSLTRSLRTKACCPRATCLPTSFPGCSQHSHSLALTLTPGGQVLGRQPLLPPGQPPRLCAWQRVRVGEGVESWFLLPHRAQLRPSSVLPEAGEQNRRKPLPPTTTATPALPQLPSTYFWGSVQQLELCTILVRNLCTGVHCLLAEAKSSLGQLGKS